MTQVSKRILSKKIEEKVFGSFWKVIAGLKKEQEVALFFSDFFSKAEKINFAKRLSVAVLLSKDYDYRTIRDLVKVSVATIGKIANLMENDGWQLFIRKLEKIENWQKFWHDVELDLWRFSGGGRRIFKSREQLKGIIAKVKSSSDSNQ